MKKTGLFLVTVLFAGVVTADLAINFKNSGGYLTKTGGSGDGVMDSLMQLLWSPVDPTDVMAIDTGDHTVAGEFVLQTVTTASWGTWDSSNYIQYDDSAIGGSAGSDNVILSGYLFVRMFDNEAAVEGDWYLQQFVTGALVKFDDKLPETIYNTNLGIGSDADGFTNVTDMNLQAGSQQVIPEPAVASLIILFGTGLLGVKRIFLKS